MFHLFGATTSTGFAFRQCATAHANSRSVLSYSRTPGFNNSDHIRLDFSGPHSSWPAFEDGSPSVWVSFAPIWLFAPFFDQLASIYPDRLQGLRGVIACSSSSAITKRFAVNPFDRQLVTRLNGAEAQLLTVCRRLRAPCHILQPTLIYGQAGSFADRNLSTLLELLRRLPCLPLPADTGLRQPIHASQLAAVALHLAEQLSEPGSNPSLPERVPLGGDTTLTYASMIRAMQEAQPLGDPVRRCRLVTIPNRLFFFLAAPLLLRSPKAFEAVLRMGANLSGFTPAHQLLGRQPQPFPVLPLA